MPKNETTPPAQSMEQLEKRFQSLNTKKIQVETQLDEETKRLEKLKADAREKFGTDDLSELQANLKKLEEDNERKRAEYQQSLDKIDQDLKQVEATQNN